MGSNLGIKTETFSPTEDLSWLGSAAGTNNCDSITLDGDEFLALFPTGIVPSGVVLYKHSGGLYRPFGGVSADESITLTEGGSGLTSWTATFGGQTTASIDDDATAAQVQAALEALSTIGVGNVLVTGGPLGSGPFTVTFRGDLADEDVSAVTTTPTGGTGTVVVAVVTPGGTDTETAAGHLFTTTDLGGTTAGTVGKTSVPLFWGPGEVIEANLPENHGLTAGAKTDLKHIRYV